LPPLAAAPTPAPRPAPALRRAGSKSEVAFDADSDALELEASDLLDELDADVGATANTAPHVAPVAPADVSASAAALPTAEVPEYQPLDADAAVDAMTKATDRAGVADAIMAFATGMFDAAVLFMVKDQLALGWKGAGAIAKDRVDCLLVPLDAPSMFQAAQGAGDGVFHGAPAPSTVHAYLYKVLRCPEPGVASAGVISIGKRVVNLLYGHRGTREDLGDAELDSLRRVTKAAADAYARLAVSKRRK
jgi:hypothetical protein